MPFTSRAVWRLAQEECSDIRQAKAQLRQGTRPSKKVTDKRDVKQYLKVCTLARDGLLVVRRDEPFMAATECTVVPRSLVHGLITAIHLKFGHATAHQMKQIMRRSFYAIAIDQAIDQVISNCPQCEALKTFPKHLVEQSTESPPCAIGINFAADVIRRERQMILILREYVTSYLQAIIVPDEQRDSLRNALMQLSLPLLPTAGPATVIRVDPAPAFQALEDDEILARHNIHVEVGRIKNPNKNPVAERAVQEFENELAKDHPSKVLSPLEVTIICTQINHKIRFPGLSSKEMLTKRDQFSNLQLQVDDVDLIIQKHNQHISNHAPSARSKATRPALDSKPIEVGDLVYLVGDSISKGKQRERYIVASVDNEWCNVRKFTNNQLKSMTYRVKRSHCYRVPCYQHQPCAIVDNEPLEIVEEEYESTLLPFRQPVSHEVQSSQQKEAILPPVDTSSEQEPIAVQDQVQDLLIDDQSQDEEQIADPILPEAPVTQPVQNKLRRSLSERKRPPYLEMYSC